MSHRIFHIEFNLINYLIQHNAQKIYFNNFCKIQILCIQIIMNLSTIGTPK